MGIVRSRFIFTYFIVYTVVKPVTEHNKLVGIYCTLVSSIEWIAAAVVLTCRHGLLIFM